MNLVLDTNLLILYIIGLTDRRLITSHKRLSVSREPDYDLLISLIQSYDLVVHVPNILTEASNLLAQVAEPARVKLRKALGVQAASPTERYVPSKDAVLQPEYFWLGLTDAAILTVLGPETVLLTVDVGLHEAALRRGFKSTNFTQHREFARR